jgi:peptide/nickel transport system substrate-binding protein
MKKFLSLILCVLLTVELVSGGAAAASPLTAPEEVKYKKEIIVGIEGKLVTWDPQASSIAPMNYVARMIFDCPMYFDWKTQKIVPNIATSWNTTDGMTYTLKLRDDVYFHNGEQLKASDVVFTYRRAVGTASSNQLGKLMEKVTAVDDFTAEIKLFKVNYDFPYMLTLNTASILNEKAVKEDELNGLEIGTGPYVVDSYKFGDYWTVRRNENFWGEKAKPERVTFRYMPDKSPRLIALQTGEIDVCQDPELLELSYITDTPGLELQTFDTQSMVYLAMNTQKEPFNNQDFRLAVAHAIDANNLVEVIREGYATDCKSCWGWNQFGYNGGTTDYEYDVEKAKEYVAKAYPNGGAKFEITVMAGERRALGEMVQSQLAAIGVEITLKEVDHAGLITAQTNGDHQAVFFSFGFNAFADDCRRILIPGNSANNARYENPDVTRLMDLGAAEGDEAKRLEYYKEVQQIVHDDAPYVPLFYPQGSFGVKKGVGGIGYYPTLQHSFRDIYMIEK